MFVLQVTRGPDEGKRLTLEPGKTYTIGCNQDASLVLTDPLVLKGHCSLEVSASGVVLRNHTATAGTFVGDQKISQASLKPNATFRIGGTMLGIAPAPKPKEAPPAPAAPDPLVGRIVGGYKLNELVGAGGMGKVYRATQLSLHRDVAFKVLRDQHVKDKNFRDLFINEARAAAQLIHPNVVQVYDAGTEGDLVFFSMEFLGKGSIEEILEREKKIPWEQAILQVLEAAHGLEYAESKGIVHRDIKPDNLMLNEAGQVKIADLGLAKRGEGDEDAGVIGTPHFIPPEQALGKQVDHRADIYSLGATFFRMITGRTLFSGKSAKEIVLKHVKEPPPAASSVDDTVPDDLDLVLAKMLAKDPDSRYQSATDVIHALEEVCAHHGIKGAIIRKGVGKKVLIPLFLLLLVAGWAIYYFATKVDPEKAAIAKKAEEDRLRALEDARKAEIERNRIEREKRKTDAQLKLALRNNAMGELLRKTPLPLVYEDTTLVPQREAEWINVAKEFEEFANGELAKEFEDELELSSLALRKAKGIREDLAKYKESADDRREQGKAMLAKVADIDAKLRRQLADLRAANKYEAAANLCWLVVNGKPPKDPFTAIVTWEWISPNDPGFKEPYTNFPKLVTAVQESQKYFAGEEKLVVDTAVGEATKVLEEARALPDEADPAAIEAAIKKLEIVREFAEDASDRRVPEIQKVVGEAGREQERLQRIVAKRIEKLTRDDRIRIRDVQRNLSSLDPDANPNSVMACDFANATAQWNDLLAKEKLKTDAYKRFARERIAMAAWCEFLFARFHVDLLMTANGAQPKPLKSLDVDRVPFADGDLSDVSLTSKDAERFKFAINKAKGRQTVFAYADFPMDWVYNSVFLRTNEPRWATMTPEIQFALAAFCFETMQYRDAARLFDEVLKGDNAPYAAAARSFKARAEREAKARAAYEAILRELAAATTSAAAEALKEKVNAFRQGFEGTIFYLDVMDPANPADELKTDFHSVDFPEVPQAPPPPEPKS